MEWIVLGLVVGLVFVVIAKSSNKDKVSNNQGEEDNGPTGQGKRWVVRQGEALEADEVFDAWTSGSLDQMLAAMEKPTNPIDRHFLLLQIVEHTYKNRTDPEMADLLAATAEKHIQEFPGIAPKLKEDMHGILPRVPTYQHYATLLTERGEYAQAIEVCEEALRLGLHDGTKSGFEGRIERIKKKRDKDV